MMSRFDSKEGQKSDILKWHKINYMLLLLLVFHNNNNNNNDNDDNNNNKNS